MVADARFHVVEPLRNALAVALLPVQRALAVPVELWRGGGAYLQGLQSALDAERSLRSQLAMQAEQVARAEQLSRENRELRALHDLKPALAVRALAAEVLYEAADPYSRKLFIDRGTRQGVVLGAPVINEAGVLGQVTQVYLLTAEVTLLTDKDAAIPVLNMRTQQRAAAFGAPNGGALELRFTSANADVQEGDVLRTSGVDGVYPPGLAVAKVVSIDRRAESGFARILLAPSASADGVRHVLVLEPLALQLPARTEVAPVAAPEKLPRRGSGRP
jgi:rod shape-determining protein MreC